jgi:hypothetical protein
MTAVVAREATAVESPGAAGTRAPRAIRPPRLDTLFTLLYALAGWCLGLRQLGDNSFLVHLRTGRLILERGVPHRDPYSFTYPGTKWIAQSWLVELAYGVANKLAGGFGIRVLVASAGAALMALAYQLTLRITKDRVRAAALTVAALASLLTVWSSRPLLFGFLGVVALCWCVELPESLPGRHLYVFVPVVMWLWANVHGSFMLGYVYLGLHLAGRWADGAPPNRGRELQVLRATVLSVVVVLLNPYGFGLLWFPVGLVQRGEVLSHVAEWTSPNFRDSGGMLYALWLGVVVIALVRVKSSRRDLVVTLPFLFLGLWAVRNVGITSLFTLPVVARAFAADRPRNDDRLPLAWAFAAVLVAAGLLQAVTAAGQADYDLHKYPVAAMRDMDRHGLLGKRLYTTDAWAGYTIARYWPQQRVFMDDRYDMYPVHLPADYNEIADVKPGWAATLGRWRIDVVVWPRQRSLSQALELDPHWKRVYRDRTAVVFVRTSRGA